MTEPRECQHESWIDGICNGCHYGYRVIIAGLRARLATETAARQTYSASCADLRAKNATLIRERDEARTNADVGNEMLDDLIRKLAELRGERLDGNT